MRRRGLCWRGRMRLVGWGIRVGGVFGGVLSLRRVRVLGGGGGGLVGGI